ncbi:MAG: molecular chaperone HtpG [Clostridia bacterium]|nr:molecular chaperone HtpG [Clostridia bacterium]
MGLKAPLITMHIPEGEEDKMDEMKKTKSGGISVSTEHIFPIIKKWLYSEREIFLRELVSNAADAVTKHRRLVSLGEAEEAAAPYRVTVTVSETAGTLTVSDNGIGMDEAEVEKYICNMALSGALEFIEKYEGESGGAGIIGHFGLGFYSAVMVADTVELVSRSYRGGSAVHWSASEAGDYTLSEGERDGQGTDVILHLNEDSREYLKAARLREILNRYCAFMPVEIYLVDADAAITEDGEEKEPKPVNDTAPLWQSPASEVTDEEYLAFYRRVFGDYREPLFSMHLVADYPLNFKGVLFFPKLSRNFESLEGQVKLYYNQVFVADNIREVIPEYLLQLRGVIDCPELPLNVSRSYLQDSAYVKKVAAYIVKKVADKLVSLLKADRADYEAKWADLSTFVEYGCISDRKFYDRVASAVLLPMADGSRKTLDEVFALATEEGHENIIYYATDPARQAGLIEAHRARGLSVAVAADMIDVRFLETLETYREGAKCLRIDASTDALKTGDAAEESDRAAALYEGITAEGMTLTVRCEHLGEAAAAILTAAEEDVRMQEMMRYYAPDAPAAPLPATLVLNLDHTVTARLLDGAFGEEGTAIARHLLSLALLSHRPLSAEEMAAFQAESYRLLSLLP